MTMNGTMPTTLAEFIPADSLAKTLGVSRGTVSRWRAVLGLPGIRVGNRLLFHEAAVAAWLKSRETRVSIAQDGG